MYKPMFFGIDLLVILENEKLLVEFNKMSYQWLLEPFRIFRSILLYDTSIWDTKSKIIKKILAVFYGILYQLILIGTLFYSISLI